ncbi:Homeodomain-like domain-containing protein [Paracoccus sulfuroxidans]|uniref:Homeodomain-like domain-containing protein n=2 Tax=Paracoccus sulfuroxidans TaxID=384678 RepID=A0A562NKL3_9RHOB|nr:Homeodomain-like domain-containing protein [Paracoccus sulfuroxidans]
MAAKKSGRPTDYKDSYAKQAEKLCALGATDQEIADFFDVHVRTIYRWKADHDAFCQSLKAGKDQADDRVERSLYQKAIGYEQDEVKIFMPAGAEEPVYAPYRAKIAPDTTAAIFWLKNRRKADWRDRQEVDHSNSDGTIAALFASISAGGRTINDDPDS